MTMKGVKMNIITLIIKDVETDLLKNSDILIISLMCLLPEIQQGSYEMQTYISEFVDTELFIIIMSSHHTSYIIFSV